jgi:hypothetical protein
MSALIHVEIEIKFTLFRQFESTIKQLLEFRPYIAVIVILSNASYAAEVTAGVSYEISKLWCEIGAEHIEGSEAGRLQLNFSRPLLAKFAEYTPVLLGFGLVGIDMCSDRSNSMRIVTWETELKAPADIVD